MSFLFHDVPARVCLTPSVRRRMSQEVHNAGTPEGKSMALSIRDLWRSYGLSVRVEQHKTLLTKYVYTTCIPTTITYSLFIVYAIYSILLYPHSFSFIFPRDLQLFLSHFDFLYHISSKHLIKLLLRFADLTDCHYWNNYEIYADSESEFSLSSISRVTIKKSLNYRAWEGRIIHLKLLSALLNQGSFKRWKKKEKQLTSVVTYMT